MTHKSLTSAPNVRRSDTRQKPVSSPHTWVRMSILFVLFVAILIGIVAYTDHKGYFLSDQANNHGERRWNSFYEITSHDTIDVLVIGNSHVVTGINPTHLSEALGCTCFDLGFSGTTIPDSYFALKEALTRTTPKLVVIETFSISDVQLRKLKDSGLSDQYKSFACRKNIWLKLQSTPILFPVEDYLPAWSTTLRNHEIIFRNHDEFKGNIDRAKDKKRHTADKSQKLYLGRYIRFTSGLEDTTLAKYDTIPPPNDGRERICSDDAAYYTHKILDLCQKHGIVPIFLTVPMYYRHVSHYDEWRKHLSAAIPDSCHWLDLQRDYDTILFTPDCFENTTGGNQHLTAHGMTKVSYLLAKYILDSVDVNLPHRDKSSHWHDLFYGEEGYFENYTPKTNDTNYTFIATNKHFGDLHLIDCLFSKKDILSAKIDRTTIPAGKESAKLVLTARIRFQKRDLIAIIDLDPSHECFPPSHAYYNCVLRPGIEIIDILSARLQ